MIADARAIGPVGGLWAGTRLLRAWRWGAGAAPNNGALVLSDPLRCRPETWYMLRARLRAGTARSDALFVSVISEAGGQRAVRLSRVADQSGAEAWFGWFQTPADARQFRVGLHPQDRAALAALDLHVSTERDTKSHPLANVPRWSTQRLPFPMQRFVIPETLESLAPLLSPLQVETLAAPRSFVELQKATIGAGAILDPAWIAPLKLRMADIERLAANTWLIVDLESLAGLLRREGVLVKTERYVDVEGLMSARVEYADVETRGCALQDVLPYCTLREDGFGARLLLVNRAWKRYASDCGFATLLSSETPWEDRHGDVLSAARVVERGELIATDLPWLVAGEQGPPVAPALARHLLRAHAGCPVDDWAQFWNRWEEDDIFIRDVADIIRRYPLLRTARWASAKDGVAHLGLTLPATGQARRHFLVHSGRTDARAAHDGAAAEPFVIFMKMLARESGEQTDWARRFLAECTITWQFDTAAGLRYAYLYEAASAPREATLHRSRVRFGPAAEDADATLAQARNGHAGSAVEEIRLGSDEGLYGDRSVELQTELARRLRGWIEQHSQN